jgi:hypothetical protein
MPRVKKDPVAQKARLDKLKDRKLTRRQELFVKELVSNDGQIRALVISAALTCALDAG